MKTPRVLLAVCLASIAVSGCSGGEEAAETPGAHNTFVIDAITLPLDATQSADLGRDLDGDGGADNQIGNVLSALIQAAGSSAFDLQGGMDAAVDDGSVILLADLRADDLANESSASFVTYRGSTPTPAPCTNPDDPLTCRQHLQGTGSFSVLAGGGEPVEGEIVAGGFEAGGGAMPMAFTFFGSVVEFDLVLAGVDLSGISAAGAGFGQSVIYGAIPEASVDGDMIPAMHAGVAASIAADCTGTAPPGCGCAAGSSGETLIGMYDDDADCAVPLTEFQANSLTVTLFAPDVDTDDDAVSDAMSFGVGITAVKGTFTPPPQ